MSRLAKTSPVHIVWNPMWPLGQIRSVERFDASDADVIAASRIDAARFGEIFDRYFADIDRYLARRVGQAIADDLAAETFVIAFRARARYDPSAADARAWLFGIAANLARRHFRSERRRLRAYARTGIDPFAGWTPMRSTDASTRSRQPQPWPARSRRYVIQTGRSCCCSRGLSSATRRSLSRSRSRSARFARACRGRARVLGNCFRRPGK
jgi:DNA-directed RNA polymerase specialized sigma24 family protein